MAQSEDTELRDLVIEALEKNGSLAKIRALLRANIFLAFEDECENIKQNVTLENFLKIPEGLLSFSIVHEFLEFCNLKNTLFVYMSESRQGKEYTYEGQKILAEKLNIFKQDNVKEPILITLIKNILKVHQRKQFDQGDTGNKHEKNVGNNYKDDQNCTYIVHEDSSSVTSHSHSDNSSDEKNKLHLRLQLDNSDTDTSSDSARDKNSSEYIPNDHITVTSENENNDKNSLVFTQHVNYCIDTQEENNPILHNDQEHYMTTSYYLHDVKKSNNNSSDSTSYLDLKPYNPADEKLLNTTGIPFTETDETNNPVTTTSSPKSRNSHKNKHLNETKVDSSSSATLSNVSSISSKNEHTCNKSKSSIKKSPGDTGKSDVETAEYSLDFTSSPKSKNKDVIEKQAQSPDIDQDSLMNNLNKNSLIESPYQNSESPYRNSQSSVSISDVADLIDYSDKNFLGHHKNDDDISENNESGLSVSNKSKKNSNSGQNKLLSGDSGDFSESPVPSLSNLSLDVHSD